MCGPCSAAARAASGTGTSRRTPPAPVQTRRWTVTYRKNGQDVVETWEGGRAQELAATKTAVLNNGSIKTEIIRLTPKGAGTP